MATMNRPIELRTLGDVLRAERALEIRCHGCGRRVPKDPRALLGRLVGEDWQTPLGVAARRFKCQGCGARAAQLKVLPGARERPARAAEPPRPKPPWERYDAHQRETKERWERR